MVGSARNAYRDLRMLISRVNWRSRLTTALRELGPYAAIGLVLPGGTLILASLWALRHRRWLLDHARRTLAIVLVLGVAVIVLGCTILTGLRVRYRIVCRQLRGHSLLGNAAFVGGRLFLACCAHILRLKRYARGEL
jgi:hypothetical protein